MTRDVLPAAVLWERLCARPLVTMADERHRTRDVLPVAVFYERPCARPLVTRKHRYTWSPVSLWDASETTVCAFARGF